MSMLDYLHGVSIPAVKITLHAGELTEGLVPPETLRFHIRESVRMGHASRIGHGAGVMCKTIRWRCCAEMASEEGARRDRVEQQRPDPRRPRHVGIRCARI